LVYSDATNSSRSAQKELERASHYQRVVVPFRVEDVPMSENMEYFLAGVHWIDDSEGAASLDQLVEGVRATLTPEQGIDDGSAEPSPRRFRMSPVSIGVAIVLALAVFLSAWFVGLQGIRSGDSSLVGAGAAVVNPMVTGYSVALKSDGTVWAWGSNEYGELGNATGISSAVPVQVPNLSSVTAVSSSGGWDGTFSLALKSDGTVWAWGRGSFGGLGDGTTEHTVNPARIAKLKNIKAIVSGESVSLALDKDGKVWAWGYPFGTYDLSPPKVVGGLENVIAIDTYESHALALEGDGTVWAWGYNNSGQLGDGTNIDSDTPVQVQNLTDAVAIAAGEDFSLALRNDGTVWSWGDNTFAQLGYEPKVNSNVPVQIKSLTDIAALSAGYESAFAIGKDGSLWSWGDNSHNILGVAASNNEISTPVRVSALTDVVSAAFGDYAAFAVTDDGSVWAWGSNASAQLGTGNTTDSIVPVRVVGAVGVGNLNLSAKPPSGPTSSIEFTTNPMLSSGVGLSMALSSDGTVFAWGDDNFGSLGNGTSYQISEPNRSTVPARVSRLADIMAISTDSKGQLALALGSDGTVWAWGNNASGGLGQMILDNSAIPVQVPGLTGVLAVVAGASFSLALKDDGTVWTWGDVSTELGRDAVTTDGTPIQVPGLPSITAVSVNEVFALALADDGTVWAWGDNGHGQLGNGTKTASHMPVRVTNLNNVKAISVGSGTYNPFALALKSDGTVWAWGGDFSGTLGNGSLDDSTVPIQVPNLKNITAIAAGYHNSLALDKDGKVWAWGENQMGELGNGSTSLFVPTPAPVVNLSGVKAIAAGGVSMALTNDGALWTWGDNIDGSLGIGNDDDNSSVPVQVIGEHGAGYLCLT